MIFQKSYDRALFAHYILRRLQAGKVDSFDDRLKSQKVQYFAQLFRVSPYYQFNLYIYGPYSPTLADDLFQIKREGTEMKLNKFIPKELEERFQCLSGFIKKKTIRQLELIATLHWLLKTADMQKDSVRKRLVEWKI